MLKRDMRRKIASLENSVRSCNLTHVRCATRNGQCSVNIIDIEMVGLHIDQPGIFNW